MLVRDSALNLYIFSNNKSFKKKGMSPALIHGLSLIVPFSFGQHAERHRAHKRCDTAGYGYVIRPGISFLLTDIFSIRHAFRRFRREWL